MTAPEETVQLFVGIKHADQSAAQQVFDRYTHRLVGLAYKNLSQRMQRRVDAEDIVQSVYRSFFQKAQEGRFTVERTGDLWKLLAAITIAKVKGQSGVSHGPKAQSSIRDNSRSNQKLYDSTRGSGAGADARGSCHNI